MREKPSVVGTVMLWVMALLVAAVVLVHGTATGRQFIRDVIPSHGGP